MFCLRVIACVLLFIIARVSGGEKSCRVRDIPGLIPREIWEFWTGYYCYNYSNNYRLLFKYNATGGHYNGSTIPLAMINPTTVVPFDYRNSTSRSYIRKSFKTDHFFQMWVDCCEEAVDCCDNFMTSANTQPTPEHPCPAIWDGWSCWGPAKANTVEKMKCSTQAYSTDSDVCELMSEKTCFANGTWNQKTDYEVCAVAPVLRSRHTFNVIVLAVATVLSFPAVAIFFSFRSFRNNLRLIFHRNLLLVIMIRNLLTIMSKEIIILDALKSSGSNHVMDGNGVACRVLAFFENAAKNGMYACMLADGFYLHKSIVRVFADEPNIVYIYAVVLTLSFLPSLIWATTRAGHGGTDCWMVDDNSNDQWIPDGFRIAILAINFLLLFDIIRVMALKLKRGNTSQQTKATLRATLFLIPLFGVHIIFITNRNIVPSHTCQAEDIYYYLSYVMEGLQGVMVAILFCYINAEVRGELKNAYRKFLLALESRFGITFGKVRDIHRRPTAATYC
ncbi:calcitonin gene-related peptide type 1 receptor [Tribolium castaneum]|uniref:calcitonin gene-related peptide type 1 receptor n=1 Tax=Tribolium castaneum TaxID=7070 RepID=UPI0030FEBEE0